MKIPGRACDTMIFVLSYNGVGRQIHCEKLSVLKVVSVARGLREIVFETKRLMLREWKEEDIPAFAAMNQDPDVMEFFPSTLTDEETKSRVDWMRCHRVKHGFSNFAVELKETHEFIGFVGLSIPPYQMQFTPCIEIGWRIAKNFWNQGYATEAARMVLHLAFEHYGLKEVVSFTSALNKPSMRVMEKLGMVRDFQGDFDHPKLPRGHPLATHVLYRITRESVEAKDCVQIEPYHPDWPVQAKFEIDRLKSRLNFSWVQGIDHIGSTAVPGLCAKPIVDLAIGVTGLESAKALIPMLIEDDYIFWEDNPDTSKLFFVKGMPPFGERRTHHIHVLPVTHHDWIIRRLFRDYLIKHPETKHAYADLKQNLASQYQSDREAYTNSKTTFIRDINLKAVKPHLHFKPLAETDFPLLLKWLEEPHIKAWWDQDITWTLELITQKYSAVRNVHGFIILVQQVPIGYIQFYDIHDFSDADRPQFPQSVARLDYYIGESGFLKKSFAPLILKKFLQEQVKPLFSRCLVDPNIKNIAAIFAYEKAGFSRLMDAESGEVCWMAVDLGAQI